LRPTRSSPPDRLGQPHALSTLPSFKSGLASSLGELHRFGRGPCWLSGRRGCSPARARPVQVAGGRHIGRRPAPGERGAVRVGALPLGHPGVPTGRAEVRGGASRIAGGWAPGKDSSERPLRRHIAQARRFVNRGKEGPDTRRARGDASPSFHPGTGVSGPRRQTLLLLGKAGNAVAIAIMKKLPQPSHLPGSGKGERSVRDEASRSLLLLAAGALP
jgi:hypothetical protein